MVLLRDALAMSNILPWFYSFWNLGPERAIQPKIGFYFPMEKNMKRCVSRGGDVLLWPLIQFYSVSGLQNLHLWSSIPSFIGFSYVILSIHSWHLRWIISTASARTKIWISSSTWMTNLSAGDCWSSKLSMNCAIGISLERSKATCQNNTEDPFAWDTGTELWNRRREVDRLRLVCEARRSQIPALYYGSEGTLTFPQGLPFAHSPCQTTLGSWWWLVSESASDSPGAETQYGNYDLVLI